MGNVTEAEKGWTPLKLRPLGTVKKKMMRMWRILLGNDEI